MEREATIIQAIFAYLSLIGWVALITGFIKSLSYSGKSFSSGISHTFPWTHKNSRGKMWAKIYWLGLIWILFCYYFVFSEAFLKL
jgi:hypothetical protein